MSYTLTIADGTVTGITPNDYAGDVVIPYGVTSIGNSAFYGCTGLTSVTLPDSVVSIGIAAFYGCTGLTILNLPNSATSFGLSAFHGCTGLTSIKLPDRIVSLGDSTFYGCTGLTSVIFPGGIESLGIAAFQGCTGLTSIIIPSKVTTLISTFRNCSGLTSIIIPSTLTSIGNFAFSDSGLTSIFFEGNGINLSILSNAFLNIPANATVYVQPAWNFTDNNDALSAFALSRYSLSLINDNTTVSTFEYPLYGGRVVIPDGVTTIDDLAFFGCVGPTAFTFPASLTTIGDSAFQGCVGITSIRIPASVTSIGIQSFFECSNLTSITFEGDGTNLTIDQYAFLNVAAGVTVYVPYDWSFTNTHGALSGLSTETYIPPYTLTFSNNGHTVTGITPMTHVGPIEIPSGVTSIGNYAFNDCTRLTSVTLPAGVTSIGHSAFYHCSELTSINLPEGLTTIAEAAFLACSKLASINLPSRLTTIGQQAFGSCTLLSGDITIPSGVTVIAPFLFNSCGNIGSVTIPYGVTSIGEGAFSDCTSLTSLVIPASVTTISTSFSYCTSLESITFNGNGEGLTIGNMAFGGIPLSTQFYVPRIWNFNDVNMSFRNRTLTTITTTPLFTVPIIVSSEGTVMRSDGGRISSGNQITITQGATDVTAIYSADSPADIAATVTAATVPLLVVVANTYTPKNGMVPTIQIATIVTANTTVSDNNGTNNTILVDLSSSTYTDESGPHPVKAVVLAPSFAGNDASCYIRVIDLSDNVISNGFNVRLVLTLPYASPSITTSDIIHYNDAGTSTSLGTATRITGTNTFEAFVTQNAIISITTVTGTPTICFLPGTPVLTPKGCVAIETIRRGDLVQTADGRTVAVQSLHRSDVKCASSLTAPYLIPAGCVAPGVPCNDVVLSPHHALQVGEGLWIEAWRCKARSPAVKQILFGKSFTYYNLGLPAATDTLVVQNGVAVESMSDRRLVLDKTTGFYRRANVLPVAAFKRRSMAKKSRTFHLKI